jgi:uncharacterized membrane protein YbhN (UPF0104 family)
LITFLVIVGLAIYLYINQESIQRIKYLNILDIVVIIGLQLLNLFILGVFNLIMLKRIDHNIIMSDAILLQYVNNFLNNILSKGGSIYRALYLKTQYNFPYSKFISAITGLYVITFLTNSLLGILSIILISNLYGKDELILTMLFSGSFFGSFLIILLRPKVRKKHNRYGQILNSILLGWNAIREIPREIYYLIFLSFLNLNLNTIQLLYIYRTLGADVNYLSMILLGSLATITQILTITPSGIGIREAVFAFSSNMIAISDEILVLGSLIIRAIALPSSILAGSISYFILQKRMKEKSIKISELRDLEEVL